MMRVVQIHEWGDASRLVYETLAKPEIADNQALVKVRASGVNPLDWKIRNGMFSDHYSLPLVPGAEFSGEIVAKGDLFEPSLLGQQVFGFTQSMTGCYAEYVAVSANEVAPLPEQLDHIIAAGTPLTALTAWGALEAGGMAKGKRILIHGAAGSVGSFAVQFARQAGAHVVAACKKSQETLVFPAVDEIHFYEDFPDAFSRDYDIVLDLVGGAIQQQTFDLLRKGGSLISTVMPPDQKISKECGVTAQMFMVTPEAQKLKSLANMLINGVLQPLTVRRYPLSEARGVHQKQEKGELIGKVVLLVNTDDG